MPANRALMAGAAIAALAILATHPPSIELVVARYAEDLAWLSSPPYDAVPVVTVYNKGADDCHVRRGKVVRLPNVGRDMHTYLHHIVHTWDALADVTVFLTGSTAALPDRAHESAETVRRALATRSGVFPVVPLGLPLAEVCGGFHIERHRTSADVNAHANPDHALDPSPVRPFGAWLAAHGLVEAARAETDTTVRGIFAVTRDQVRRRPRAFYERLLRDVDHHPSPEAVHYLERAWLAVFAPVPDAARFLARPTKPC